MSQHETPIRRGFMDWIHYWIHYWIHIISVIYLYLKDTKQSHFQSQIRIQMRWNNFQWGAKWLIISIKTKSIFCWSKSWLEDQENNWKNHTTVLNLTGVVDSGWYLLDTDICNTDTREWENVIANGSDLPIQYERASVRDRNWCHPYYPSTGSPLQLLLWSNPR